MRAETVVPVPADVVRTFLLDLAQTASWNPAITSVSPSDRPAERGVDYRVKIRGILPARLTFDDTSASKIGYRLSGLGSTEAGSWSLAPTARGTSVVHEFTHEGVLLGLMGHAFAEVAEWRVHRLRRALSVHPLAG